MIAFFLIGIFLQFFILTRFWQGDQKLKRLKALGICLLISTAVFLPLFSEDKYSFESHLTFFIPIITLAIIIRFRKEIVPLINKQSLLQITILFWYFVIKEGFVEGPLTNMIKSGESGIILLCIFATVFTLMVLFISFSDLLIDAQTKVLMYVWYFFVCIVLSFPNFAHLMKSLGNQTHAEFSIADSILSGMFFFYIIANIGGIILIKIALDLKTEDEDIVQNLNEYRSEFITKFENTPLQKKESIFILISQSAILIINYIFKIVDDFVSIYLSIILIQIFQKFAERKTLGTKKVPILEYKAPHH